METIVYVDYASFGSEYLSFPLSPSSRSLKWVLPETKQEVAGPSLKGCHYVLHAGTPLYKIGLGLLGLFGICSQVNRKGESRFRWEQMQQAD